MNEVAERYHPKAGEPERKLVAWAPNKGPQTALISCPHDEIFYGGAKGGGKSDGILGDWVAHLAANPKHARGIIFRKTFPSLEQLMERARELMPLLGGIWKEQKKTWYFPSGATLKFRFVETLKDAKKYQGHQYTWMAFDEVGEIKDEQIVNELRGALRNTKGVKVRLVLSGNPQGDGHQWLFNRFIKGSKPYRPQREVLTLGSGGSVRTVTWTRVFIPAKLEDNPKLYLGDPLYELRLKQMTVGKPWLYKALREGDWYVKPEVPGALWTMATFDKHRVESLLGVELIRIVVAVDPSGSGNPASDECGIVVSGKARDRHKYVLEDLSLQASPKVWASVAAKAVHRWEANALVAEVNFGGEMVTETLQGADPGIKVTQITCSRGKHLRAEPVAAEDELGFIHHVGFFTQMEAECTTWLPDGKHRSPNRLDARVFGMHWLGGNKDLNIRSL